MRCNQPVAQDGPCRRGASRSSLHVGGRALAGRPRVAAESFGLCQGAAELVEFADRGRAHEALANKRCHSCPGFCRDEPG